MQPDVNYQTHTIMRIAAKEITLFFASPIAYLFLATFAAVTLFIFFWGEAFFSRNIADVRPLFEWMPVLLIFLASTLTMRLWSEERRTGTLEHVLTQPTPLWHFVVGKFIACLGLLAIALVMTLPLPITVALISELDWGPVWAGYLATLLLGAAYLSVGLFVSARSDNQIVSLISAAALCGVFYLFGTPTLTDFFGNQASEWLRLLGSGSRFESITRGVIDLRDLYYYFSIIAVFLTLNTYFLERERWAATQISIRHKSWRSLCALLLANALCMNLWLGQITALRIDTTQGNQYSISDATERYLDQLQEPLLLRGYFSGKTHPLLSPLVPQLRNLLQEYEIVGRGNVRIEFVDPITDPDLEQEANQKYGIQPVPFQVADRYQASVVNSYFNILVQYGDEYNVLGFNDFIEIKTTQGTDIDVQLRNPEHDITRAIKKVLNSYQAGGNLFDTVKGNIDFNAYISADTLLPEQLIAFKRIIDEQSKKLREQSQGRLDVNFFEPEANNGAIGQQIANDFGFQPMRTNLFSQQQFYFYLTLAQDDRIVQIPLDDMQSTSFTRNFESALKRFASGFTKTVTLVTAPAQHPGHMSMGGMPPRTQFNQLERFLGSELNIERDDLSEGTVPANADILLLAAPANLDEKQLFAVDQFLMQGGTVIAATSPYTATFANRTLGLQAHTSGLEGWLSHHGLSIEKTLVLDSNNTAFPAPVTRNLGGFQVQEIRMLDYPYFIDVRDDGLNQNNSITADLPQATLSWASPIVIDNDKQQQRELIPLLHSSEKSWLSSSTDVLPRIENNGLTAYTPSGEQSSHLLGVIAQGRFDSWFADKTSPLLEAEQQQDDNSQDDVDKEDEDNSNTTVSGIINRSPESARIILISSNDFLRDEVVSIAESSGGSEYLNTLQLMANNVDWSLEDAGLLSIRSRGHFNRTLPPIEHGTQLFWEYLNYGLALLALVIVALIQHQRNKARQRHFTLVLAD